MHYIIENVSFSFIIYILCRDVEDILGKELIIGVRV